MDLLGSLISSQYPLPQDHLSDAKQVNIDALLTWFAGKHATENNSIVKITACCYINLSQVHFVPLRLNFKFIFSSRCEQHLQVQFYLQRDIIILISLWPVFWCVAIGEACTKRDQTRRKRNIFCFEARKTSNEEEKRQMFHVITALHPKHSSFQSEYE